MEIKQGDIYILGNHRLMCGDSTNPEDVARLMDGVKADLVFTDPPYGMGKQRLGVKNDNLYNDKLLDFNKQWIPLSFEYLKGNGSWYCWGKDEPLMDIYGEILKPMLKNNQITFRNLLTWDKGDAKGQKSGKRKMYTPADEKCLFVMKGVQDEANADRYHEAFEPIRQYLLQSRLAMGWDVPTMKRIVGHSDLSRDHWTSKSQFALLSEKNYNTLSAEAARQRAERGIENDAFCKAYEDIRKEYESVRGYFDNTHDNFNNVWHFKRATPTERKDAGNHPTIKPLDLCRRAIKSSSRESDIIVDLFGGSGSTLIACEQLGRRCYIMELSPDWCKVIIERFQRNKGLFDSGVYQFK